MNDNLIPTPSVDAFDVNAAADAALALVNAGSKAWNLTATAAVNLAAHVNRYLAEDTDGSRSQRSFVREIHAAWRSDDRSQLVSLAMVQRSCLVAAADPSPEGPLAKYLASTREPTLYGASQALKVKKSTDPIARTIATRAGKLADDCQTVEDVQTAMAALQRKLDKLSVLVVIDTAAA